MDLEKINVEIIMPKENNSLIQVIDENLPTSFVVLDGDHETLYVKERNTGKHYEIKVSEIVEQENYERIQYYCGGAAENF